jgi:hypothetical protein
MCRLKLPPSRYLAQFLLILKASTAGTEIKEAELEKSYDVGLVGMTIHAVAQRVQTDAGITVTKLTLVETITEVWAHPA